MKKLQTLLLVAIILPTILSCSVKSAENKENMNASKTTITKQINVYYFHFTRRCTTCRMVEEKTNEILKQLYANEMEDGIITFKSVNLDEGDSKEIAEKLGVSGQTLLFVSGEQKVDLTNEGFMYSYSNTEKLKEKIQKTISELSI